MFAKLLTQVPRPTAGMLYPEFSLKERLSAIIS